MAQTYRKEKTKAISETKNIYKTRIGLRFMVSLKNTLSSSLIKVVIDGAGGGGKVP